jgi:uncharacterized protein (DUF2236 family)
VSTPILPDPAEWPALVPGRATITWRRAGDARVLTAAGYALLLQVSHPTVGAGVTEHSSFRQDPWGRLLRTLDYACTMVYGGAEAAGEMGRDIRRRHAQLRGTKADGRRYHALEPEAYAWVHATLAQGIVLAHERFGRRFSDEECEQLWAQWRSLGRLLGIRAGELPGDWSQFAGYFDEMVDRRLERTPATGEVLEALARPAPPELAAIHRPLWPIARTPLSHLLRLTTVGLLTPGLRRRLGVGWSRRDEVELRGLSTTLRAATPLMPAALRNTGPGYLRWRREAMATSRQAATGG